MSRNFANFSLYLKFMDTDKIIKEKIGEISVDRASADFLPEKKEAVESKEVISEQELKTAREKIESMDLSDGLSKHATLSVQSVKDLKEEEKLEHLLQLAKTKGVIFAVKVAQKMNDPCLLDMLHDKLAENGYYKEFLR